ncbi:hypothetical protein NQ314_001972 [Rhamnusium bicolor]|uniref:PiggyBac transposable element-derived protein domain-containing protein n=1 Tax=Rhamnusium bicolor TaxID=1586634 RepID=A0AAV8ZSL3_9CUCU|nr:hypothetical protein NQ314_001972 [Rhamnusium bicolor]
MGDYEKEQNRLLQLLEDVESEIESADEDEGDEDHIEERDEDSNSEQDLETEAEENIDPSRHMGPYFLGRDKTTKWRKHTFPQNVRTRSKNLIIKLPAVKGPAKEKQEVIDIWNLFFDDSIIDIIVLNTNKYIESVQKNYTRPRNALKTNALEIRALLGLLYFGAVRKVNHLNSSDLWKTNGTSVEIFRLVMSQYRFRYLLRYIRFDDKSTRLQRLETDKLTAIRELFEAFVVNCQKHYNLSAYRLLMKN